MEPKEGEEVSSKTLTQTRGGADLIKPMVYGGFYRSPLAPNPVI